MIVYSEDDREAFHRGMVFPYRNETLASSEGVAETIEVRKLMILIGGEG